MIDLRRHNYYEFDTIPETTQDVRDMTPVKTGTVKGFDLSPRKRDINFAFAFNAFVQVPDDAEYTFTLTSDDGSVLCVNGKELIDNGGLHGMVPKKGSARLRKGRHKLECLLFQGKGGYGLKVEMAASRNPGASPSKLVPFNIDDPTRFSGLKLRVMASDKVAVFLNGKTICRFHKKRRKHMFDRSWKVWEKVTLMPKTLELLRAGDNMLGVSAVRSRLGVGGESVGIQLQGIE